ncbi:MAG: LysR family transcriptional regulator [Acidobacteria bacterium]|nr:LysR family transcriptional regulator [Acidobacteriota bacterium]
MISWSLTQLEYLVALDEHRNFTQAASACHVSQPTLSTQVQKLEELLGAPLFDRLQKPLEPTQIGHQVVLQARHILAEAKVLDDLVSGELTRLAGPLKIGVIPTLSPYLIPWFVGPFMAAYPEIQLQIEEMQTAELIVHIAEERLDAGLLVTPLPQSSLRETPLYYEPFVAYLNEGHPLLQMDKIREEQVQGDELWLLQEGHCFRDQAISLCRDQGRADSRLVFESGSLETLIRLVDRGMGMTILPYASAMSLNAQQKHRIRQFHDPQPVREVSMVTARAPITARAKALIQTIIAHVPAYLKDQQATHRLPLTS